MGLNDAIDGIGEALEKSVKSENSSKNDIRETAKKVTRDIVTELSGKSNTTRKQIVSNIVGFMSAGGGAGASTLVANIGKLVKKKGLSVAIVDLNIVYPSQHLYFNVAQEKDRNDIYSLMSGKVELGSSLAYSGDIALLVANNRGIVDYINGDDKYFSRNLEGALDNLSEQFDLVLVDCPLDISNNYVNSALYKFDNLYIVIDDGVQSIVNIPKIKNAFDRFGMSWSKCRFVMNKRTSNYYNESNLSKADIKLVEIIPFDLGILTSGLRCELYVDKGVGVSKTSKDVERALNSLCDKLLSIGGYVK